MDNLNECKAALVNALAFVERQIKHEKQNNHIENLKLFFEQPPEENNDYFIPVALIKKYFGDKYSSKRYGIELQKIGFKRKVKKVDHRLHVGYYLSVIDTLANFEINRMKKNFYYGE